MADADILLDDNVVQVSATLIGEALGLPAADVLALIGSGELTSSCEKGEAEDAGRYRLTFFIGSRRLRIVVDHDGQVLERDVDVVARPFKSRTALHRGRSSPS